MLNTLDIISSHILNSKKTPNNVLTICSKPYSTFIDTLSTWHFIVLFIIRETKQTLKLWIYKLSQSSLPLYFLKQMLKFKPNAWRDVTHIGLTVHAANKSKQHLEINSNEDKRIVMCIYDTLRSSQKIKSCSLYY